MIPTILTAQLLDKKIGKRLLYGDFALSVTGGIFDASSLQVAKSRSKNRNSGNFSEVSSKTEIRNATFTKRVTRFTDGGLFEHTINTKKGPIDFMANTKIKGDTLILDDVVVSGNAGKQALTSMQREIFRSAAELKDVAREQ